MSAEIPNPTMDSHGPLLHCPIFYPETGTEIMNVHVRDDGFVEISIEGEENPERLETRIITQEDYQAIFPAQP